MRPGVAFYNLAGEPKKTKGLRYWIKNKPGTPPVLTSEVNAENTIDALKNELNHQGYFEYAITYKVIEKKKTQGIVIAVRPGTPFRIKKYEYPEGSSPFQKHVLEGMKNTKLAVGQIYRLDQLIQERNRLSQYLRRMGYYYIKPEDFIFKADSVQKTREISLELSVKPEIYDKAKQQYALNKIYIFDDFKVQNYQPDTSVVSGISFISQNHEFKPKHLGNSIFLKENQLYSIVDHRRTLNHLSSLGSHSFASIQFEEGMTPQTLDAFIYLTPLEKMAISAETGSFSNSIGYIGPGVRLSYKHRNLFGGAEQWVTNLSGKFEVQLGADSLNTSIDTEIETGLEIPRLLLINSSFIPRRYVPKTDIKVGLKLFRRLDLYTLNSFFTYYGYRWNSSPHVSQNLDLIDVSLTKVRDKTDEFEDFLDRNPNVKTSFEDQLIIGSRYRYTLSQPTGNSNRFFFEGRIDLSGNVIGLADRLVYGPPEPSETTGKAFGLPISQFAKFGTDFRYFWSINPYNQIAFRMFSGIGLPYGNSSVMPFVKQFFVGGTNSIRAFTARSVGPGSYQPPSTNLGVDQSGDIKLETSLEYRFDLTRLLKGALFADAGNIWLRNRDESREGADFQLNRFYKEIAVGTGLGIRFDSDFFVLRMDFAFPLRVPSLPQDDRWVIDEINVFNQQWRRENIIWNLAIGYPF
ncbi:MAG: BamA/TamA family outer membrane protein [Cyclobacteriaceae bacterium]